ncbi:MAG: type II secretion system protein [Phycisphaerales bacterium JB060]
MRARGFSLIELLVVVAILMILIGLALPTLSRSRDSARLTVQMARIRDNGMLISMYADSNNGRYPIGAEHPENASLHWWQPLIEAGLLESKEQADPEWFANNGGNPRYAMSFAMCYDPERMTPEGLVPYSDARTSPIRQSQVLYPSDKGLMWQWWVWTGEWRGHWCCAPVHPVGPIVMADLSAEMGRWPDYVEDGKLVRQEGIGGPIMSTWHGVRGRDRR